MKGRRAGGEDGRQARKDKVCEGAIDKRRRRGCKTFDCKATEHDTLTLISGLAFTNSAHSLTLPPPVHPFQLAKKEKNKAADAIVPPLCLQFKRN